MAEPFAPITTRAQLEALDHDSMVEGYRAGMGFIPVNHTKTDQGYWHGFHNGQVDRGVIPVSFENAALARELLDDFRAIFAEKH